MTTKPIVEMYRQNTIVIPFMGGGRMDKYGARYVLAHRSDYTHETVTDALWFLSGTDPGTRPHDDDHLPCPHRWGKCEVCND